MIDNRFRAARVGDLANNIAEMQMNIKGLANDMSTTNNRAYEMLEALAKRAGYPTVKEYVDQAIGRLSEEDRKKYALIRGEVVDRNDRVTKAQDISGIIVAIAMSAGLGESISSTTLHNNQLSVIVNKSSRTSSRSHLWPLQIHRVGNELCNHW